jgi:glycosyltransferase involved in cell wall biosynthesis
MTAFNGSKYIKEQLHSFAIQTRLPDEVVVCDDLSSDDTFEILDNFSRTAPFKMILVRNEKNLGYSKNFEKALTLCSGDLIFLSDQDDIWYEEKIARMIEINNSIPINGLIICDAIYTDEKLKSKGVTVLEKVLKFSGRANDHIAGACTAITKNFRDFILPFPEVNCPAHDVYIHRWANLLNTKIILKEVLQVWRIHDKNNSRSEMNTANNIKNLSLYKKYKDIDSSIAYQIKASQFQLMHDVALERVSLLEKISGKNNLNQIQREIKNIINANLYRSNLCTTNPLNRIKIILVMICTGKYKYFQGIRSIAKDLLR